MLLKNDFLTHWKVKILCKRLGDGPALRALISLWSYCEQRRAWEFKLAPLELAGVCDYGGAPEELFDLLVELRLITPTSDGFFEVNGWGDMNASLVHKWPGRRLSGNEYWHPRGFIHNPAIDPPIAQPIAQPIATPLGEAIPQAIGLDRIGLDRSTPKAPKGAAHSPHPVQGSLEQTSSVENHAASAKKEKAAVHSEIYDAYPRKVGKPQALKAIGRAIRDTGVTVPELLTITRRFAEAVSDWPASERQFIPHPATWFNGHRFLDGPAEWGKAEVTAQKENGAAHPYASDSYAAPISSASAPEGWLQAWSELYTFPPPPTWLDVPPANVTEVTRYLKQHAP